jgi:hypothetical protein
MVAAVSGLLVAGKLYDSGESDPSFIIAMSLAAVVTIALIAPQKFSSLRSLIGDDDPPYTSDSNDPHFPAENAPDRDRSGKTGKDAG